MLGLNFLQTLRHVILPQATKVAFAPTVGFSVQVVKGTALAAVIGFVELTKAGTMLNNATFEAFQSFCVRRTDLFCPVLPAVPVQQIFGEEVPCR